MEALLAKLYLPRYAAVLDPVLFSLLSAAMAQNLGAIEDRFKLEADKRGLQVPSATEMNMADSPSFKGSRIVAEIDGGAVGNVSVRCKCEGERRSVYLECHIATYDGDNADQAALAKSNALADSMLGKTVYLVVAEPS